MVCGSNAINIDFINVKVYEHEKAGKKIDEFNNFDGYIQFSVYLRDVM